MATLQAYRVVGMHCESCITKVTAALQRVQGVVSASVSLTPPQAQVELQHPVPLATLNDSLRSVGSYSLQRVASTEQPAAAAPPAETEKASLYPLLLIVAYLVGTALLVGVVNHDLSLHSLMRAFMGGFFLVFSFFKLLDLRGFAGIYRSYDVVAKAWPTWGYAYPLVELLLGAAYIANWNPRVTNLVTLVLMLVGAVGVLRALLSKTAIRCACLGTVLNLPMTTVTLIEDLGMAVMAAFMLLRFV